MGKKKSVGGRKAVKVRKALPKKAAPIYNSDDDVPDESADNFIRDDIDTYNDECTKSSAFSCHSILTLLIVTLLIFLFMMFATSVLEVLVVFLYVNLL